ncbi:hypothetical protein Scep_011912 [Stephania cephalantha]|uniref:Uncharacterized protein n=1 Tax=Stephania cephalantha TaxID=152367 RepID=A0AAP0P6Z5_9MAGN
MRAFTPHLVVLGSFFARNESGISARGVGFRRFRLTTAGNSMGLVVEFANPCFSATQVREDEHNLGFLITIGSASNFCEEILAARVKPHKAEEGEDDHSEVLAVKEKSQKKVKLSKSEGEDAQHKSDPNRTSCVENGKSKRKLGVCQNDMDFGDKIKSKKVVKDKKEKREKEKKNKNED